MAAEPGMFRNLPRALRLLRKTAGLETNELAHALGLSDDVMIAYESGNEKPSLKTLFSMLSVLDCTLVQLHHALVFFHEVDRTAQEPWRADIQRCLAG